MGFDCQSDSVEAVRPHLTVKYSTYTIRTQQIVCYDENQPDSAAFPITASLSERFYLLRLTQSASVKRGKNRTAAHFYKAARFHASETHRGRPGRNTRTDFNSSGAANAPQTLLVGGCLEAGSGRREVWERRTEEDSAMLEDEEKTAGVQEDGAAGRRLGWKQMSGQL